MPIRPIIACLAACLGASMATADSLDGVARGELLTGWRTESGTHIAGLRITLAPGWKTYWRAPGDAGIPPHFNWSGSKNISSVSPSWPVPEVFEQNGMRSVGYEGTVTFPLTLEPQNGTEEIQLRGEIEIGVCEEICVPMTMHVSAVLPAGAGSGASDIKTALDDAPMTGSEAGVRRIDCRIEPISDGMRVSAEITMPRMGRDEEAVIELMRSAVWVSEPEVRRDGDILLASAELVPPEGAPFALERDALRFTILADGRAVDIRGCG